MYERQDLFLNATSKRFSKPYKASKSYKKTQRWILNRSKNDEQTAELNAKLKKSMTRKMANLQAMGIDYDFNPYVAEDAVQ